MKRAGIIALVMIFLFQAVGVFLLLKLRQQEIKQEIKMRIKAGVPESELTVFKFDDHQLATLKWVDDHEFILDGQMYDIVKTSQDGDILVYHCLHDKQETIIFKNLNRMVADELGGGQNRNNNKHQISANWYFTDTESRLPHINPPVEEMNTGYLFRLHDQFIHQESPPPKFVVFIQG